MSKSSELIDLTDQTDLDFRFERDDYYAFGTGEQEDFRGGKREKLIFLSKEFCQQSYNPKGIRVFTMPSWYATNKGLV